MANMANSGLNLLIGSGRSKLVVSLLESGIKALSASPFHRESTRDSGLIAATVETTIAGTTIVEAATITDALASGV